ncbi:MAG: type II toxin-antitoxin system VapB family antitoxin [Spirochaetaceae bacterium]|jgi:Arc/MetJ family transcription regulator|nr:type II toxin-antitoxin system VapB family antitoxin [Spirochaetaceae bacterium]
MDTAIMVDEDLLDEVLRVSGGQDRRQMVEETLRNRLAQQKQIDIRKYRGRLHWEGDLDALRRAKWLL